MFARAVTPARKHQRTHHRRRRLHWLAVATIGAVALSGLSPIVASAAGGDVRSFDTETLGEAPSDCTSWGDVTIAPAPEGDKSSTNRALRVSDQSASVHTRVQCVYAGSAQKSIGFDYLPAQLDSGFVLAVLGTGSSSNGVWRFSLKRSGTQGLLVQVYNGASWLSLGTVDAGARSNAWSTATLTATVSEAVLDIAGVRFRTSVTASSGSDLTDVHFASAGTASVGTEVLFDDLQVTPSAATGFTSVRSFDSETLGVAPSGCTSAGSVIVASATAGSRPSSNRAVRLTDNSPTVHTTLTCPAAASAERSAYFTFSTAKFDSSILLAVMGSPSGGNGVWRFSLIPTADGGANVSAYNGSTWSVIGHIDSIPDTSGWAGIEINATLSRAVITVGDTTIVTTVRASTSTALTGIVIGSGGTSTIGLDMFVDDLEITGTARTSAIDRILVEPIPLLGPVTVGQSTGTVPVARFLPLPGTTAADYRALATWGSTRGTATISGPDASGYLVVSSDHTFDAAGVMSAGARVVGPDGAVSSGASGVTVGRFATTLVATAASGTQIRFPDVIALSDGSLLTTYYESAGHTSVNGVIKVTRSADDGQTWTTPLTAVDIVDDPRDPKLAQLQDGTIILSYFAIQWTPRVTLGTFTVRSIDGGATWSSPVQVDTQMSCSCGPISGGRPSGAAAQHGPIVELSNGDLLIPLYGDLTTDPRIRATVVRSTDGGLTWDAANESTIAVGTNSFMEPNLTVLPSGEIIALIRTNTSPERAWMARSFDNGVTWTTPAATDLPAQSHHQLLTSDGRVLLTYGDPEKPGRPTMGVLIEDPSASWNGYAANATPIYDAKNSDQGNPSSAEIAPGEYVTMGYNYTLGTLYAVFTNETDYVGGP